MMNLYATDYCPQCCVTHVTAICPREDETESQYWARIDKMRAEYEPRNPSELERIDEETRDNWSGREYAGYSHACGYHD